MDEFVKLFHVIRKIEVLFLPLFPRRWRMPPPSYRLFSPLLHRLAFFKEKYPWTEALSMWLEGNYLPAYHKRGLAIEELSSSATHYVRLIMLGIAAVVFMALLPHPQSFSYLIHGALLIAMYGLAFFGAMKVSVSAVWLVWGVLYVPAGFYMMAGAARWLPLFLGFWSLVWQAGVPNGRREWRWYDMAATLPFFFFWMEPLSSSFLETWTIWQRSLLCAVLWVAIWILLFQSDSLPLWRRTLSFFWPSSQMALVILVWFKLGSWKGQLPPFLLWLLWLTIALSLCVIMGWASRRLATKGFLHHPLTLALVLIVYLILVNLTGIRAKLEPVLSNSIHYLYNHSWPIWFFLGASTMMAFRGAAMTNLRYVQMLLPPWLLPGAVWIALSWAVWKDGFSTTAVTVTLPQAVAVSLLFGLGATWLAWRKKEKGLQEWLFWGLFAYFLFQGYWKEAEGAAYQAPIAAGWKAFLLLSVWALWFSYNTLCRYMTDLKGKISDHSGVALMGALLLMMMTGLWLSFVDQRFSVKGEILFHLFLGFTYLGIPLILHHFAVQYKKTTRPLEIPWGWVVLCGVVLIQLLQGAEHYAAGLRTFPSLDHLHRDLVEALNNGRMEQSAPAWVLEASWAIPWRLGRWLAAMIALTCILFPRGKPPRSPLSIQITTLLTGFTVSFAEMRWIDWPGLPYTWAVVLRPWQATQFLWDWQFLSTYALYAGMGFLWGWVLCRIKHASSQPPQTLDPSGVGEEKGLEGR